MCTIPVGLTNQYSKHFYSTVWHPVDILYVVRILSLETCKVIENAMYVTLHSICSKKFPEQYSS